MPPSPSICRQGPVSSSAFNDLAQRASVTSTEAIRSDGRHLEASASTCADRAHLNQRSDPTVGVYPLVIEASYASAIIGVVDRPLFRRGGTTQPKGLISTAWASISTEVWIESASWFQTARNSERSRSRRCKCMYIHSRSVRCAPTAQ